MLKNCVKPFHLQALCKNETVPFRQKINSVLNIQFCFNRKTHASVDRVDTYKDTVDTYKNEDNDLKENKFYGKIIKVSIIGIPNVGKSTFINSLVEHKVCPASKKVHTTRKVAKAVINEEDTQIVFLDTPGLVSQSEVNRFALNKSFMRDPKQSMSEVDVVGVIHDVSHQSRDRIDSKILRILEKYRYLPSFLILNKIDLLKSKRKLLELTRLLTDNCLVGMPILGSNKAVFEKKKEKNEAPRSWKHFSEVFMVSSLTGDGIQDVKDYLMHLAKPGEWLFDPTEKTDQSPEQIIGRTVRATLLDFLPQEIPYLLTTILEYCEFNEDGSVTAVVLVKCPTERIGRLVAGVGDGKLKQITACAQQTLRSALNRVVSLKLIINAPTNTK